MILKSKKEIDIMIEGGKILAGIMEELKAKAISGVTTKSLDILAEKLILQSGGESSFKGYEDFPATICTNVNEVIVHGVPSDYILKEGDILTIDIGILYKEFHTDMAVTIPIGMVEGEVNRLLRETKKALKRGIKKAKLGNTLGDIGNTISRHVEKAGFVVVEGLCGHGIGRELHEEPQVLNEGKRGKGIPLEEGMVFCIETMLSAGAKEITRGEDGIAIKTADDSLSTQFEHTIAITKKGPFVITSL